MAYDEGTETIYVRFLRDGVECYYKNCPRSVWEEFSSPATSKGRYIKRVLDTKPYGRLIH